MRPIDVRAFYRKGIDERAAAVLKLSQQYSVKFLSDEVRREIEEDRLKHPAGVIALKCSDGRVKLALVTKTPMGVAVPFRNIGGRFDFGWYAFNQDFRREVAAFLEEGDRLVIAKSTYHYSPSSKHLCCAGFRNNTPKAIRHALYLRDQLREAYRHSQLVYPAAMGLNTDTCGLTLRSENGREVLDISHLHERSPDFIAYMVPKMLSCAPEQVRKSIICRLVSNLEYTIELESVERSLELTHTEGIICLGRGFEFVPPNLALIVGPYSDELDQEIYKAAKIVLDNMRAGRVASDGLILLVSMPFRTRGSERNFAALTVDHLAHRAEKVLRRIPELRGKVKVVKAIKDWDQRLLRPLPIAA